MSSGLQFNPSLYSTPLDNQSDLTLERCRTMSTIINPVLIHGIVFNQVVNFFMHSGKYNVSRAQIRFILFCAAFDGIERRVMIQYIHYANYYRYLRSLCLSGHVSRVRFGRYELTDLGRSLVSDFWAEHSRRCANFRW